MNSQFVTSAILRTVIYQRTTAKAELKAKNSPIQGLPSTRLPFSGLQLVWEATQGNSLLEHWLCSYEEHGHYLLNTPWETVFWRETVSAKTDRRC